MIVSRPHIWSMRDTERLSETVLERNQRREAEINAALKQEADRHAAAIKNMHRLRALRLQHDKKAKAVGKFEPRSQSEQF
jgi:hypothetical protein